MKLTFKYLFFIINTGLLINLSSTVFAQENWPNRPITMVIPFPPGGVADTVGRPVADALSRSLGQPVIVENRAGAGGGIGMAAVAKSKPDGYTILMALSSISIIPEADKILGKQPSQLQYLNDQLPNFPFDRRAIQLVRQKLLTQHSELFFLNDL